MSHTSPLHVVVPVALALFLGQAPQANWVGTWVLDADRSTFGAILFPGAPADISIVSQTLTITQTETQMVLSGDTVVSGTGRSYHDATTLRLDGAPTTVGPASLALRQVDRAAFEVVTQLTTTTHNVGEISRFAVSSDGMSLTETKTQTARAQVLEGADPTTAAVLKTSTSVLLFVKVAALHPEKP